MKVKVSKRLRDVLADPRARRELQRALMQGGRSGIRVDGKTYRLVPVGRIPVPRAADPPGADRVLAEP